MSRRFIYISLILLLSPLVCAESFTSSVPLAVDSIQTKRVNNHLVRVIQYNMEMLPQIEIELIETPKIGLVDQLRIQGIRLGDEHLVFASSAGTYIDSVTVKDNHVVFIVDYFRAGKMGGEVLADCRVTISGNKLSSPVCKKMDEPLRQDR